MSLSTRTVTIIPNQIVQEIPLNCTADVLEVLARCNFTTTAYNTASAQSILSSVASSFASASGSVAVITSGTVVRTTSIAAQTRARLHSRLVLRRFRPLLWDLVLWVWLCSFCKLKANVSRIQLRWTGKGEIGFLCE
jgi:hypothetical protein